MRISSFSEKLNKVIGNIYTIEEELTLADGVYEGELLHDNINSGTVAVFTGPKLTGERLQTYVLSTPSLTPWKRNIRIYADTPVVYVSYETDGDTVEAEDINWVQEAIAGTQEALNEEADRAGKAEEVLAENLASETARAKGAGEVLADNLADEVRRATGKEAELASDIQTEADRAKQAETVFTQNLDSEVKRAKAAEKTNADNLVSEVTRAKTAEEANAGSITEEVNRAVAKENALSGSIQTEATRAQDAEAVIRGTISTNKPVWDDKYTRNEVDNKFSAMETAIDWKEAVGTFGDLAATYPRPEDGWTVNVKDTDYTYRWSGTAWVAISANAVPKATQGVDGLLSKEDKTAYDDANTKKHTHGNKTTLDKLTEALLANWTDAYNKRHEHANKTVLDKITQVMLDKLAGIAEGANKYVHPTTAGSKHIPAGGSNGQFLKWSADGTATWASDNNTTYGAMKGATAAAAGTQGLVPTPAAGKQGQFLRGDGTWAVPEGTTYTHPNSGVTAGTYRSVTVNAQGHVTTGANPTTLAGYGITDAAPSNHDHDSAYLKKGAVTWNDLKGV